MYLLQAKDSVTGEMHRWTNASRDGTGYPGPNTATELAVVAQHGAAAGGGGGGALAAPLCATFTVLPPETGQTEAILDNYYGFTNDAGFPLSVGPNVATTRAGFPHLGARYRITVGVGIDGLLAGTHDFGLLVLANGGSDSILEIGTDWVTTANNQSVGMSRTIIVDIPPDAVDPYVCVHLPTTSPGKTGYGILTIEFMGATP